MMYDRMGAIYGSHLNLRIHCMLHSCSRSFFRTHGQFWYILLQTLDLSCPKSHFCITGCKGTLQVQKQLRNSVGFVGESLTTQFVHRYEWQLLSTFLSSACPKPNSTTVQPDVGKECGISCNAWWWIGDDHAIVWSDGSLEARTTQSIYLEHQCIFFASASVDIMSLLTLQRKHHPHSSDLLVKTIQTTSNLIRKDQIPRKYQIQ